MNIIHAGEISSDAVIRRSGKYFLKKGENQHDFHRATARVAPTHHFDDVNEMTGKNWDIWAKYHLEKRNEKAYNNSRKSAETKDETVFMDI